MKATDIILGRLYKVQADKDPTVEQGRPVYFNGARTTCLVVGIDPDDPEGRQGFIGWIAVENILECMEPDEPEKAAYTTITVQGQNMKVI